MTTPICGAPQCDRPANVGHLCGSCLDVLRRDLKAVPDLIPDLDITISRQDRLSDTDGRGNGERPLPLRLGPMEARRDLTDTLRAWSEHIAGRRGIVLVLRDPIGLADWLSMHLGDVQDDPRAGDLADEIGYALITAQRAVDKPLQHTYVGPCDLCGADLYGHPRSKVVACRNTPCEAEYNIDDRRTWLLGKAEDQLMTATGLSRALPGLIQVPLNAATIRSWAHRGKLTQHPPLPDKPKEPVYRCGDVIALLHEFRRDGAA